jgi:predicted nucleotidyltransferase
MYEKDGVTYGDEPLGPRVVGVEPLRGYRLLLTWDNGERRVFDAAPLLELPAFRLLKSPVFFNLVTTRHGSIAWPKDIDYCPDTLYMESAPADKILDDLVTLLKSSDPYKIILFGSYAGGNQNENSDIDLMVILDNNHVSKTHRERLDKKVFVKSLVLEINRKVPLDILVYSREELDIIKKRGNYFIDEIERTGRVIYEKAI